MRPAESATLHAAGNVPAARAGAIRRTGARSVWRPWAAAGSRTRSCLLEFRSLFRLIRRRWWLDGAPDDSPDVPDGAGSAAGNHLAFCLPPF